MLKLIMSTTFLAIISIQITILQCTSGQQETNEDFKQTSGGRMTSGELDASDSTARDILEMATERIKQLEEMCRKRRPSQVVDDGSKIPIDPWFDDYDWGGKTRMLYRDCAEAFSKGIRQSGVYVIQPTFWKSPIKVFCDMKTAGGGWTVFQRRADIQPREDFYRGWDDYKKGFGNLNQEFWLGNDFIFALSNQENMMLRVDLEDYENNTRFAQYKHFRIRPETENYKLVLGPYSGDAGDSFSYATNLAFSTKDRKNDLSSLNCAQTYKGAWWYRNCHYSNLNGLPHKGKHSTYADGINWNTFKGFYYSLKFTEMKIRPSTFS